MRKETKDFRNTELKTKVKDLIKKSKDNNLIKSHVFAYKDTPVKSENHRGNLAMYRK